MKADQLTSLISSANHCVTDAILASIAILAASISPFSARFFVALHHTATQRHCAVGSGSGYVYHKWQKRGKRRVIACDMT